MSVRRIVFAFDEYFHIYNRGNSKQDIFLDNLDRERFQSLLFLANGNKSFVFREVTKSGVYEFDRGTPLVYIGAYCLMPNHFHILLTPAIEGGIQTFLQKLSTGYSMYFNRKYERSGVLFEGKFKARHVDSDEYLKYLFAYIHLNPVKLIQSDWKERGVQNIEKVQQYLNTYRYSSLIDYIGEREEHIILSKSKFPEYFLSKKEIDEELLSWLSYRELIKQE